MSDKIDLAALRSLCAAATPGPWRQEFAYNNTGCPTAMFYIPAHNQEASVEMLVEDAAFIAAAREAVPALIAEVERLRAEGMEQARRCACVVAVVEEVRDRYKRERDEARLALVERLRTRRGA